MMTNRHKLPTRARHSFAFILMSLLLTILWASGGASRADVFGQVVVRVAAWAALIAFVIAGSRPPLREVASVAGFSLAAVGLVTLHLIPLPPAAWSALPGRSLFEQAATVSGQEQPWRPLSISPGATVNALSSLIVPVVVLVLAASLKQAEHRKVAALLVGLVVGSTVLGLLQFSGGHFDHPLINDVRGSVSGSFANRNHFALFVAFGCVLIPALAFSGGYWGYWRAPIALALLLLFGLIILASGSRMGMLVGLIGAALGLLNVRRKIATELRRLPRRVSLGILIATALVLASAVLLSIALGRAVSLDRAFTLEAGEDLRQLAFPTVWGMTKLYFPFGSGVGTFDPVYRIHEPDDLLSFAYFNHAHNDLLEVILDAGLPGLLMLLSGVGWWLWKSVKIWRPGGRNFVLGRIGSAILLLTLVASITDYPVRTPMIMAVLVIAAVWLNGPPDIAADEAEGEQKKLRRPRGV